MFSFYLVTLQNVSFRKDARNYLEEKKSLFLDKKMGIQSSQMT